MEQPSPEFFKQIFEQRYAACRELQTLSERQQPLIEENNLTQLMEVLRRKQELIERISQLVHGTPGFWESWQTWKNTAPESAWNSCQQLLQQTELLLAEILHQEQTSTQTLERKRDETQDQLQQIARGSEVHEAYQTTTAPHFPEESTSAPERTSNQ